MTITSPAGPMSLRALPTRPPPTMIAGPTSEDAIARGGTAARGARAGREARPRRARAGETAGPRDRGVENIARARVRAESALSDKDEKEHVSRTRWTLKCERRKTTTPTRAATRGRVKPLFDVLRIYRYHFTKKKSESSSSSFTPRPHPARRRGQPSSSTRIRAKTRSRKKSAPSPGARFSTRHSPFASRRLS